MNAKLRYQCPVCLSAHDRKSIAEDCCPHSVKEVLYCGECGEWFDWYDKERAEECCKKKVAHRMFLAEVERAKRFCLCGAEVTPEDARDSAIVGSVPRCRSCILAVAPELQTADAIILGRAA
jgi:hypothetical protein